MRHALAILLFAFEPGCSDECQRVETSAELTDALASASSGDRICLGGGRFEGSFATSAGVEICGAGRDASAISGREGEIALLLRPDAGERVTLCDLRVEYQSRAGVLASGEGSVTLRHVDVAVRDGTSTGFGVAAENLASLAIDDVAVTGSVDADHAADYPLPADADAAALASSLPAYGVVAIRVADVSVEGLDVRGFAVAGVELVESASTWSEGAACSNLGTGVLVHGGTATVDDVEVCDLFQGGRALPTFGMAVAAGAVVESTGLSIVGTGGGSLGLLQDDATGRYTDLSVTGNLERGVEVTGSTGTLDAPGFEIAGGDLSGNGYAGIVVAASSGVVLSDLVVGDTTLQDVIFEGGPAQVGDGVQLVTCPDPSAGCAAALSDVALSRVTLRDNGRVGLLVSGDGQSLAGVSVEEVSVSGDGDGVLGAIHQLSDDAPIGWDTIDRSGSVAAADGLFDAILSRVGVLDPEWMPEEGLAADGLAGAVGDF